MVLLRTRCSGASCDSCQTRYAEIRNETTITSDARPPDTDFGSRLPIVELTTKPANGSRGMNGISEVMSVASPLQRRERIGVERFTRPEERDDEREAHGRLGGRHGHHEERDDLAVHRAGEPAERDEAQIHRVEHDLD